MLLPISLRKFWLWFPEEWIRNDSGQVSPPSPPKQKQVELSFVCMTGLILSVYGIFIAGFQFLFVIDSNWTLCTFPDIHTYIQLTQVLNGLTCSLPRVCTSWLITSLFFLNKLIILTVWPCSFYLFI